MLKTPCLTLFLLISIGLNAQTDTLETKEVLVKPDSSESVWVYHCFLWWNTETWYKHNVKVHKTVRRRRFLRNMFKRNPFDRTQNMKFKTWDENGTLIFKAILKPYSTAGRRKNIKYSYYSNGKVKSKSVRVIKGRYDIRKEKLKEFDETGKKIKNGE